MYPSLVKIILLPLGVTAATGATDVTILKKVFGSGTTLIVSNKEMNDIMEIVKSFEVSGLFINSVRETIKMKPKNKKVGFLAWY